MNEHTICAPGTAPGSSGISVIRISGPDSLRILRAAFKRDEFSARYMHLGNVYCDNKVIDKCLGVYFPSPNSYTGEDMAEIHAHGSNAGVQLILTLLTKLGAQPAAPGEFTKRAFINGKLDLAEAEAVAEYISADSESAALLAARRLKGDLSSKVNALQDDLTDIMAGFEAAIQYPEEDFELPDDARLANLKSELERLSGSFYTGRMLSRGVHVVIAGRPNVGKSSLLNALLGVNRAIVTQIPGTTRDIIEERFSYRGAAFVLTDTAGIRDADDTVEKIGVERSCEAIAEADAVLMLLDGSETIDNHDRSIFELAKQKPHILVLNKSDVTPVTTQSAAQEIFSELPLLISAVSGKGIDQLLERLYSITIGASSYTSEDILIAGVRQHEALERACRSMEQAISSLELDADLALIDMREAWDALCSVTGRGVSEDVIDRIFEKFCLGK